MRKKFICGMFFLLCGIYTIISTPAIANHQQGPQMLCGERTSLLETFKKDFNEIPVEQGVQLGGVLIIILANETRNWTMFVSRTDSPYTYCSLMSGTHWTQNDASSTGILSNGSVIAIGSDDKGTWSLVILNIMTGQPKEITRGTGWERLINLNIQSNSL